MSRRKTIIRQSKTYSLSTFLTQAITLTAAFLTRNFLGPTQMGIWSTLQILVEYSKYTAMGTMAAVPVEIPYWIGKGDSERAEKIKNTAFVSVVISALFFCAAIVLFASATAGRFHREVTFGLYFVAAVVLLQRVNNLLIALLRCYKKFEIESGLMIWSSIVNAGLIAVLAYRFKIYGFILALAFSFIFNIAYLMQKYRYHFRWFFDRQIFRSLLARGFPLMLIGVLATGLQNIDRMIIAKMMGFELLGFYSIALMVCAFISNFFNAANAVLIPHFQEKFGESDNPNDLCDFLFNSSLPFALIMPIFIIGAWIVAPYLIGFFLPKFIPGITAMKLLVLSMFFVPLANQYQVFLITIKKHARIFPVLIFLIALAVGLSWFAIRRQSGIEGVALVITFVAFINFTLSYFTATQLFARTADSLRKFFIFLSCFGYLAAFLLLEDRCIVSRSRGVLRLLTEGFGMLIFCTPLLLILNKRFSFLKHFFEKATTKTET